MLVLLWETLDVCVLRQFLDQESENCDPHSKSNLSPVSVQPTSKNGFLHVLLIEE